MDSLPEKFILLDTEYTTWEGALERKWNGPNEYKEIVQIGSIIVDKKTLSEKESQALFVKPVKNPQLSKYFVNLTGISQKDIEEKGLSLEEALRRLKEWAGDRKFYSFGGDGRTIQENCTLINIEFPFDISIFHDIQEVFEKRGISTKGYMSSTIVRAFGVEPTRRGHDALNDVRQILDGLRLLEKGKTV